MKIAIVTVLVVALAAAVVYTMYYRPLYADGGRTMRLAAERTEPGPGTWTLDPDEARDHAPVLADALDRAIQQNLSQVLISEDEDEIRRIGDYLSTLNDDPLGPFHWRGTTFRLDLEERGKGAF